ncbi:hypothetical protein NPIL_663481 [Nephila pilipes]|uniref:Uncharacterized protein n=1 Tax=Nephila pilipes TaxID=299642 RepID=A0A8X6UIH0_NEPPI|nr:hypothetical protein NPIL_663481 [Nephila pilipes]
MHCNYYALKKALPIEVTITPQRRFIFLKRLLRLKEGSSYWTDYYASKKAHLIGQTIMPQRRLIPLKRLLCLKEGSSHWRDCVPQEAHSSEETNTCLKEGFTHWRDYYASKKDQLIEETIMLQRRLIPLERLLCLKEGSAN